MYLPNRYFYKSALRDLRNRSFGMDTLISLSSTLIYLYSSHVAFTRKRNFTLYFGSDGVLLSLILFGTYIEDGMVLTVVPTNQHVVLLDKREEVVAAGSYLTTFLHLCQEPRTGND